MKRRYYSGGVGELLLRGRQALKIADLEEVSILLDYSMRPIYSERDEFPVAAVPGPGSGTVSCVARVIFDPNPITGAGGARAFKRDLRLTVPDESPFKLRLPDEPAPESLIVETPSGDVFDMAERPSAGFFSYDPGERALYFAEEDAGHEVLVSYAYGEDEDRYYICRDFALILVFPALGRSSSEGQAFRVIEARRAVLSSWSEEFLSGRETLMKLSFILLSDEDGFITRERIVSE